MDLSPYLTAVAEDVQRTTALADENTQQITNRLLPALEPGLRLALTQAISDTAAQISAELDEAVAVVHLEGRNPVITVQQSPGGQAHSIPTPEDAGENSARVTVRLPDGLKSRAEASASAAGQSLNSWIVHAIRTAADGKRTANSSRRVTGWA